MPFIPMLGKSSVWIYAPTPFDVVHSYIRNPPGNGHTHSLRSTASCTWAAKYNSWARWFYVNAVKFRPQWMCLKMSSWTHLQCRSFQLDSAGRPDGQSVSKAVKEWRDWSPGAHYSPSKKSLFIATSTHSPRLSTIVDGQFPPASNAIQLCKSAMSCVAFLEFTRPPVDGLPVQFETKKERRWCKNHLFINNSNEITQINQRFVIRIQFDSGSIRQNGRRCAALPPGTNPGNFSSIPSNRSWRPLFAHEFHGRLKQFGDRVDVWRHRRPVLAPCQLYK